MTYAHDPIGGPVCPLPLLRPHFAEASLTATHARARFVSLLLRRVRTSTPAAGGMRFAAPTRPMEGHDQNNLSPPPLSTPSAGTHTDSAATFVASPRGLGTGQSGGSASWPG